MKGTRPQTGSITVFGVILSLVLVVLGSGFLFITLFMGGQKEVQNAVDSGALNIGKQVEDNVTVDLTDANNERCFYDVSTDTIDNSKSCNGKISLRRINRLWGEAMLICINAKAAGGNAGAGSNNAQMAVLGAQNVSDALYDKLTNPSNLYSFFTDFTHNNSVRMLGNGVTTEVMPGNGWQTSLMNRDVESNIVLNGGPPNFNLPQNFTMPNNVYMKSNRPNLPFQATNYYFLKGYTPLTIGNNTFWQVPFQYGDKPHLVAKSSFESCLATINPLFWTKPLPNAYSAQGQALKGDTGERARSFVLTNPNQPFQLAIPHGFVHIHLDDQLSHWFYFPEGPPPLGPTEYGSPETYGYSSDVQSNTPMPAGGAFCSLVNAGDVTVGSDVAFKTLDGVIFTDYNSKKSEIEKYLVARINEMLTKPGSMLDATDLHNILSNSDTISDLINGERDFYLYSPDGATVVAYPKSKAISKAPWLAQIVNHNPDGNEEKVLDDGNKASSGSFPTVTPSGGASVIMDVGWSNVHEDVYWTTGSGFNSCLGELRIKQWTNIYSLGVCSG